MDKRFNPYEFPTPSPQEDAQRQSRIEQEVVSIEREEQEEPEQPDLSEEQEAEREREAQAEAEREARRKAREANPYWQFISGNWLTLEGVTGIYRYLLVIAVTLFLSVVSIFYSFHLGEKYTRRSSQVQLLRERSIEYSRVRFNSTSHTAIIKELKRRNIPLYDIQESKTIIEK